MYYIFNIIYYYLLKWGQYTIRRTAYIGFNLIHIMCKIFFLSKLWFFTAKSFLSPPCGQSTYCSEFFPPQRI